MADKGRYIFAALLDGPDGAEVKAWLRSRAPFAVDVAVVDERRHCFIEGQRSLIQTLISTTNIKEPNDG